MGKILSVEISESLEDLKSLHSKEKDLRRSQKLQALYLYKSGVCKDINSLSLAVNKSYSQVKRWLRKYRQEGLMLFLEVKKPSGRPKAFQDSSVIEALKEKLSVSYFTSYVSIVEWLKSEYNLSIPYRTVHQFVRYTLGAKLKVARPQSLKNDPQKVEDFKKV